MEAVRKLLWTCEVQKLKLRLGCDWGNRLDDSLDAAIIHGRHIVSKAWLVIASANTV